MERREWETDLDLVGHLIKKIKIKTASKCMLHVGVDLVHTK